MATNVKDLPEPIPKEGLLTFEQPLSERIRTFLRIELLYRQALFHTNSETDLGSREAVNSLLGILSILAHGDVRAEALKELDRLDLLLGRFRQTPGVDTDRLGEIIDGIAKLASELSAYGPHLVGPLKESEFLNAIKHRAWIPGGTCGFDLPDYGYWLNLPYSERAEQLTEWTDFLRPLCDAVNNVLGLLRDTSDPVECVANDGLYNHKLDRKIQHNLVRVMVPTVAGIFPEFSAGNHQFTIRFVEWQGVNCRPQQVSGKLKFQLALS